MCNNTRNQGFGNGPDWAVDALDPFHAHMCSPKAVAGYHVLDWLSAVQDRELKLCSLLEDIADELPSPLNHTLAAPAVPGLRVVVPRHEVIVRQVLFPRLRKSWQENSDELDAMIERFSRDNAMDTLLAHDAADLLEASMADGGRVGNVGMLAYVLRGVFEGRRRHIEWEKAVLFPLAQDRLNPEHLQPLADFEVRLILSSGRECCDGTASLENDG